MGRRVTMGAGKGKKKDPRFRPEGKGIGGGEKGHFFSRKPKPPWQSTAVAAGLAALSMFVFTYRDTFSTPLFGAPTPPDFNAWDAPDASQKGKPSVTAFLSQSSCG